MIRSIQGAAIVPGRLGYSQVAHHRAFESPSRESHRSPSKGRRLHACAPRFFLSDLNTTADTFLDNPFSRPPVVGNGIEKASRKSPARRAVVDHIHPRERNAVLCCQVWDFFFSDFSRVPSSWTFWSLARPSWKRKMTLRQWGGLMFNRKHTSRQKPPKLPSHCLARWKDVREVCAASAPSPDLHRNEALPAFILDSTIMFSIISAFSYERWGNRSSTRRRVNIASP